MIGFWISASAMAVMVALVLLRAMRQGSADAGGADLAVYRDQLAEVDRDQTRGTLAPAEALRLRTEVQRRMLDADRTQSGAPYLRLSRSFVPSAAFVLLALTAAGAIYATLGVPGYPDLPLSARLSVADEAYQTRPTQDAAEAALPSFVQPVDVDSQLAEMIQKLRDAVANRPDDLLGHTLLAQNEASIGNFAAAGKAQKVVVSLKGDTATAEDQAQLAALLIAAAGGIVTPQAELALVECLKLDPRNGWARFYSGLMFAQIGRPDRTFSLWDPLLREGPDSAPWITPIRERIEDVAGAAGINFALPALNGPDAADVTAAADMSAQDRQTMIKTMVAGLEERLYADGGSVEEWAKLITSLGVLQEHDRARAAFDAGQAAFVGKPGDLAALRAAAITAGLTP